MAVYTWTHLLQCIVVVRSFLRMLKLRKLAVYLSRGGPTPCHIVLEHGLNTRISLLINIYYKVCHKGIIVAGFLF